MLASTKSLALQSNHNSSSNIEDNNEEEAFGSFTTAADVTPSGGETSLPNKNAKSALNNNNNKNHGELSSLNEDERVFDPEDMIRCRNRTRWVIPLLILLMGSAASAAFIALGITAEHADQKKEAETRAKVYPSFFRDLLELYQVAGLWAHQAVRHHDLPRESFRDIYEHVNSTGLEFKSIEYLPRVEHQDRAKYENESRAYYAQHYPEINYTGFLGLENTPNGPRHHAIVPRSNQTFYFVQHYVEPVQGNENQLDFDAFSTNSRRVVIQSALHTGKPALSRRLGHYPRFTMIMVHPGMKDPEDNDDRLEFFGEDQEQEVLTKMTFDLNEFVRHAVHFETVHTDADIYLFDTTPGVEARRQFLGGSRGNSHESLPEILMNETREGRWKYSETFLAMGNRRWTIVVIQDGDKLNSQHVYIILGGAVIFVASSCLALWVHTDSARAAKIHGLKRQAEQEKAQLMVASANQAARAERELNDYVAHEVRNPLAAAISAHSFVRSELEAERPLITPESRTSVRDDMSIIGNSLHFINDLLRSMLDTSRASTNRLEIETKPTDLRSDVLEPIHSMLYLRDCKVEVLVDCPNDLIISTDCLRLKQVVLNLARNSSKFVQKGFIRLRAEVVTADDEVMVYGEHSNGILGASQDSNNKRNKNNTVRISVQDSGPGVPPEKHEQLFSKFQSSLDSLNQGTGIGLSLSKKLVDLMGMELWLDETFDSGVDGLPGASFVIDTNIEPEDSTMACTENDSGDDDFAKKALLNDVNGGEEQKAKDELLLWELPSHLTLLFVDDDMILRKLFARTIRKVAPDWTIHEAANGETALKMVEQAQSAYDAIFVDQYMASVEQQLLGTETVRALRARGVGSVICGLSANNVQAGFEEAGANGFVYKPFPTEPVALRKELHRVLEPLLVPVTKKPTDIIEAPIQTQQSSAPTTSIPLAQPEDETNDNHGEEENVSRDDTQPRAAATKRASNSTVATETEEELRHDDFDSCLIDEIA